MASVFKTVDTAPDYRVLMMLWKFCQFPSGRPIPGSDKEFSELLILLWTWDTTLVRIIDREAFEAGIS